MVQHKTIKNILRHGAVARTNGEEREALWEGASFVLDSFLFRFFSAMEKK